ncbi:MAG: serine/threonine protein kinase [Polyangiaceae bacterium]|nr:serine/threonine protein kinase [Polyangiaceae bacterium]
MSFWQRLKKRLGADAEPAPEPEATNAPPPTHTLPRKQPEPAPRDPFAALRRPGTSSGELAEALEVLARARGTQDETQALAALLDAPRPLADRLGLAAAELLVLRGQEERALELLAGTRSAPALMMQADLFAARGDLARAIGAVERVLAKAIDTPGALERRERWAQAIGFRVGPAAKHDEATMVAPAPSGVPFLIQREVARGGAGAVYEATDEVLGRRVAFKVYHGEGAARAALEREVRVAAKLAGPGVVRVLDASPERGWVALEWASLGSLKDVLRVGRRDVLEPFESWLLPLASALARVHRAGWVHADVKPANVLFRSAGEAILADFGIARPAGSPGAGGSAGYVAPERLAGAPASPADDVYGFGRTLEDVLDALQVERADLAAVVAACLAPAAERPKDADELLALLSESRVPSVG